MSDKQLATELHIRGGQEMDEMVFEVFPWNDNFETGITIIDDQHRRLVQLLNEVAQHVASQSDEIALDQVFADLAAYADYHFKSEEAIWQPVFSDDLWFAEHQQTHDSFMEQVHGIMQGREHKRLHEVIEEVLRFLTHWLAFHILDNDKRMAKVVHRVDKGTPLTEAKTQADEEMSGSVRLLIDTVLDMYDTLAARTIELMKQQFERARIEEQLKLSQKQENAFSDTIMNIIPAMIYLLDEDMRLMRWNEELEKVSGYSEAELQNKHILDFFRPQSHHVVREGIALLHAGKRAVSEEVLLTISGEGIPCLFNAVPLEIGGIRHIAGIAIDISERKKTEAELKKSQAQFYQAQKMEAIGTLVGGIAHDFNNMLAGMTGNLFLARMRASELPEVVEKLSHVEKLSFRAAEMIEQLLTFARKGTVVMQPLPLTSSLKEMFKLLHATVPENIELIQEISPEPIQIEGNLTQLNQVVMNLVNNARDALVGCTKPNIRITLDRFRPNQEFIQLHPYARKVDYAHLCVSDNGTGINPDVIDHIFEPFFTTKAEGKGTGLGLSMVFGAVKTHQGFIEAENLVQGGAAFHIYLPLMVSPQRTQIDPQQMPAAGNFESILIADDHDEVRKSIRKTLEYLNYQVSEAGDGAQAVEIVAANPEAFDLIIMDIIMPRMGGIEAAEKIHTLKPGMKIIFSTGYDRDQTLSTVTLSEETTVLSKPFTVDQLSRAIRAALIR